MILPVLFIAPAGEKGRGVFVSEDIAAGTVIENSPVIVLQAAERVWLDRTRLHDYIFEWGEDRQQCCVALGYVSLYNHSFDSNCEYEMDFPGERIEIRTCRSIRAGEELLLNYTGDLSHPQALWFEAK